ncbi:HAMP domain-containing protein [Heliobacterium gestii]|uniref:histidine kinase n=1 Tax=Heliomicrobium gestii TaxID=2699 RepID=A0A845L5D3_HELGE|nr:HAMP domain-containing sensor histidine kinase [Heliomicrobium gestii]MBM7865577.1 signal transduction histidine kinase [Heliomicrobium gestii]MZP41827.1 HAMP domain-containing protein [Heliomicrobium gestii]
MRHSIKFRLFLAMSAMILFFVLLSSLLVSTSLGRYYIYKKTSELRDSSQIVATLVREDPLDLWAAMERLERTRAISSTLMDANMNILYSTFPGPPPEGDLRQGTPPPSDNSIPSKPGEAPHPPNAAAKEKEDSQNGDSRPIMSDPHLAKFRDQQLFQLKQGIEYGRQQLERGEAFTEIREDPRMHTQFLNVITQLPNGDYLFLSTPLAAIQESAAVANRFFLFTGLITLLLGNVIVFFYTRRFTRPILEMNDIARRMATLDFQKKVAPGSKDELGQLAESINSLSDQLSHSITELREKNAQLQTDIERERKIDEMRKEFISNVSHELKTPIALIQGYAEGLKVNVADDEESRNYYCDVIMDESRKMNKLVLELLDLSQIESGQFHLERSAFDALAWAETVMGKFTPLLRERGIQWTVDGEGGLWADADQERMEQVLSNYLTNAIHHITPPFQLTLRVIARDDKIRVTLFNSGNGIPEEALDQIWTSFYKVDKARTRAYGGTGLGLSVVRAIQRMHQNRYGAENVPGGVLFWFELDKAAESTSI